jgi:predicted NBD/HSP70 family sugar kinase
MRTSRRSQTEGIRVPAGSGAIVAEIAGRGALSRQTILQSSGLARATVVDRLDKLFRAGILIESSRVVTGPGRPTTLLDLSNDCAIILAADVGETFIRLAVADVKPQLLVEEVIEHHRDWDPRSTLEVIALGFEALILRIGCTKREILGVCIGLPAPVDFAAGTAAGPSVIPQWEGLPVRDWLTDRLGVPAYVENDVNLLTLAEKQRTGRDSDHFFFVKVGTGIGSGIMSGGILYRGHKGVAGDIGHIQLGAPALHRCRCGKIGCVESRASGWAIARDLRTAGLDAQNAVDVLRLIRSADPSAIQGIVNAGEVLGEVIADAVSILNPDTIAIGGTLAGAGEYLLSGLRAAVFKRTLPIANAELNIVQVDHQPQLGLIGAALLVRGMEFAPTRVEATIQRLAARSATNGAR